MTKRASSNIKRTKVPNSYTKYIHNPISINGVQYALIPRKLSNISAGSADPLTGLNSKTKNVYVMKDNGTWFYTRMDMDRSNIIDYENKDKALLTLNKNLKAASAYDSNSILVRPNIEKYTYWDPVNVRARDIALSKDILNRMFLNNLFEGALLFGGPPLLALGLSNPATALPTIGAVGGYMGGSHVLNKAWLDYVSPEHNTFDYDFGNAVVQPIRELIGDKNKASITDKNATIVGSLVNPLGWIGAKIGSNARTPNWKVNLMELPTNKVGTSLNNDYSLSTLTNRFKNSNWYNFYFGKNEPITITINEPGSNPITTQINKRLPLRTKVMRASSLLRHKKPGTTLTIDGLPGKMVVTEVPLLVMTKTKETLLPRIKKLNPNDHGGSSYVIDKMNKAVVFDEDLMNAANGDINGFASVNPKYANYFPIGIVKPNNKPISFFTWIHELRHKLEHMIKLSPELKALLEKAYKGIPKGERLAVNTELRTYLLKDMENVPPEILNMFLDKYANNPEVVMDKLEFLNGYGQRYVLNLYRNSHKPNEITNIVQDMINAMKYVPLVENQNKVFEKLPKGIINLLKIQ